MKKDLTVVSLFLKSVLYKSLWIIAAMLLWETISFYVVLQTPVLSLESAVEKSFLKYIFMGALALIGARVFLSFKSIAFAYTCRLIMSEKKHIYFAQAASAAFIFLILFLAQQIFVYILGNFYIFMQQSQFVTNQTLFLAFYRSDFLHFLIPLSDLAGWLKLIVVIAALSFACCFLPSERMNINAVQLLIFPLVLVLSVSEYTSSQNYIAISVFIFFTAVLIISQHGKDEWYEPKR